MLRNFSVPLPSLGKAIQALCSYRLRFAFKTDAGALEYLRDREFSIPKGDIYFTKDFFEY